MPGKLPIDRVRAAEDAPRIYEDHKQRFTEKQAKLRTGAGVAGVAPAEDADTGAGAAATPVVDDA